MPNTVLPTRASKNAPSWDGKGLSLDRYFEDVDDTADSTGHTTDNEKINIVLRYVSTEDEQLWKGRKTANITWATFKSEVKLLYRGVTDDKRYTWTDLRDAQCKYTEKLPKDKDNYREYHREFLKVTEYLIKDKKMSLREGDMEYMKGIRPEFKTKLLRRLSIVKVDHAFDDPYAMDDVLKAAEWTFTGNPSTVYKELVNEPAKIKKETVEISQAMRELCSTYQTEMQTLVWALTNGVQLGRGQNVPQNPNQGYAPRQAWVQQNQLQQNQPQQQPRPGWNTNQNQLPPQNQVYQNSQPQRNAVLLPVRPPNQNMQNNACLFCSGTGHFMRECTIFSDYIRVGKCLKNQENKIIAPDGRYFPRDLESKNWQDRINRWLAQNPPSNSAGTIISTNTLVREEPLHMLYMSSTTDEVEDGEIQDDLFEPLDSAAFTMESLTDEQIEVYLETRKKADKRQKEEVTGLAGKLPQIPKDVPLAVGQVMVPKYKAPIEDTVNTEAIMCWVLNLPLMITVREFYAFSVEARKHIRELVTTKKVPTVDVTYNTANGEPLSDPQYILKYNVGEGEFMEENLTSSEIDSLCVIRPKINDMFQVEGILDQGSEIIAMNRTIWQKLGMALNPKKILNMQSANSQSNTTEGVIQNLKFTFEDLDLLFQDDGLAVALATAPLKKPKKKPKKYTPVTQKVHSVAVTMPDEFRIIHQFPSDPLEDLIPLNPNPPVFMPGKRIIFEQLELMNLNPDGFLWPEEEKLAADVSFRADYFQPVKFPVLAHTPWQERNIPIPLGIHNKVVDIIKAKIASGVYEPSTSSYRSSWFCVDKNQGTSLRLVHNLKPLNKVTIKDAGCPPILELYAESFGGQVIYGMFDLFVGFDEIPNITQLFVDDTPCKGGTTYYQDDDGTFGCIALNPGIRRFVWEHLENVNRISHRIKHTHGTFNA
ncbi:hypothetical protein C8J57DRAFT_1524229 [Mycena rebaudengoi]|nr:hypothetical protein C8J57DRAFT_1524229 [Mycena rebaudengoi]